MYAKVSLEYKGWVWVLKYPPYVRCHSQDNEDQDHSTYLEGILAFLSVLFSQLKTVQRMLLDNF